MLVVKSLSANAGNKKMWAQSLHWKDPLEEDMATHYSILAWRNSSTILDKNLLEDME